MQIERGYVAVNGLRTYREVSGSGDPVVLLHGGLGTVLDFKSQVPELSRHYRVIAFERRGHGRTEDTEEEFSYESMRDHTIRFLEGIGKGPFDLIGWSDGGVVALMVAIARPELVRHLVSIGGGFSMKGGDAETLRSLESATPDSFREMTRLSRASNEFMEQYDSVTPDVAKRFPVQFAKTRKMWLTQYDIIAELARISAPTLVMCGDRDFPPIELTVRLYKAIKGAQLCVVPGSTHMLLLERPQLANGILLDFLKGNR
jgi:pimeloyl-ACP methyl ester carboxylesterase